MQHAVSVKNVSKRYRKNNVLRQVDLMIGAGSVYGLIGPSGAGKTTLVKMVVGMEVPDQGEIHVLGQSMPNLSLMQRIGYMAQSDALYFELTGRENLQFFGSLYQLKSQQLKERMKYVADLVNLEKDLSKKVSTYSGGMKRRLSLAIAFIQNPDVLILDEPTVGIDPALRLSIWNELLRLKNEEGKTIIVTTHVMDEAEKCDCIAMIREGAIITTGSPSALKKNYSANNLDDVFLKAGRM